MSWKKLLQGEPMPDKDDPKYKETYERQKAAGMKFADVIGISWCARHIHRYADANRKAFLFIAFGIVIILFILNVVRIVLVASSHTDRKPGVELVEKAIQQSRDMKNKKSQ